jgi:hypothetical protein
LVGPNTFKSRWTPHKFQLKTTIGDREALIEQQIEAGGRAGTLTAQEQADLRVSLNHIEQLEGQYLADGNLSQTEAHDLVDELSRLSRKLNVYITNKQTEGYASSYQQNAPRGNGYGYWTKHNGRGHDDEVSRNQAEAQAMIDSKQAEVDSALSRALVNGQISQSDAAALRARLNSIANAETLSQADGRLSYSERDTLISKLNDVDASLKASIRTYSSVRTSNRWGGSRRFGRNETQARSYITQRINTALASGKITPAQAKDLLYKQRRITAMEGQMQNDGMSYSFQEQKSIMDKLDQLSDEVDAATR